MSNKELERVSVCVCVRVHAGARVLKLSPINKFLEQEA